MTVITTTTRNDLRSATRTSAPVSPLGGSYTATARTAPRSLGTRGTYVTSNSTAPATPGSYVTTEVRGPVSGGSYTYAG